MSFKNKILKSKKFVEQSRWVDLAVLLRDLLTRHAADLSYDQAAAAAGHMLRCGEDQLSLELAQLAIAKNSGRVEAPEIMFFLMLKRRQNEDAAKILTLIKDNGDKQDPRYLQWEVLLLNQAGDSKKIAMLFDQGLLELHKEDVRFSEMILSIGGALIAEGRVDEARKLANTHCPLPDPFDVNQINFIAKVEQAEERMESAADWYKLGETNLTGQAAVECRWNKSLVQLAAGSIAEGWEAYESRWEWDAFPSTKFEIPATWWSGEKLSGKTILIWGEQGIGDEILFLSLLPSLFMLKPSKVGLAVSDKVKPLVRILYPQCQHFTFSELQENLDLVEAQYEFHLPAGSLPLRLACFDVQGPRPMIASSNGVVDLKKRILSQYSGKKRIVGVSWRSGVITHKRVHNYVSINGAIAMTKEASEDCLFLALQYGLTDEEREALRVCDNWYLPNADFFNDLVAQASFVKTCDLVLTSSSACLAIAGVCGVPTITWGPKNIWTRLGFEEGYPWFPNVHYVKCETKWDLGALVRHIQKLMARFYNA